METKVNLNRGDSKSDDFEHVGFMVNRGDLRIVTQINSYFQRCAESLSFLNNARAGNEARHHMLASRMINILGK